jgi:hypothetical protein
MLIYRPRWLFFYPGVIVLLLGLGMTSWVIPGQRTIAGTTFHYHTMLFGAMMILIGFESMNFAVLSKMFATTERLLPEDPQLTRLYKYITPGSGIPDRSRFGRGGRGKSNLRPQLLVDHHFGTLNQEIALRIVIPGFPGLTLGVQVVLSSFFMSVLGLARRQIGPSSEDPFARERCKVPV